MWAQVTTVKGQKFINMWIEGWTLTTNADKLTACIARNCHRPPFTMYPTDEMMREHYHPRHHPKP